MSGQQIVGRCSICFSLAGLTDEGSLIPHTNGRTKMPCAGHYPISMVTNDELPKSSIVWLILCVVLTAMAFFLGLALGAAFSCPL